MCLNSVARTEWYGNERPLTAYKVFSYDPKKDEIDGLYFPMPKPYSHDGKVYLDKGPKLYIKAESGQFYLKGFHCWANKDDAIRYVVDRYAKYGHRHRVRIAECHLYGEITVGDSGYNETHYVAERLQIMRWLGDGEIYSTVDGGKHVSEQDHTHYLCST